MEILPAVVFLCSIAVVATLEPTCSTTQLNRFIDISTAKLEPSKTYQYHLELHDTPVKVEKNGSEVSFRGHFATLMLRNTVLKRQYEYRGTELVIKIPADHVFSPSKHASLEVQILFDCQQQTKENIFSSLMLSQLYMISKFHAETQLSQQLNADTKDGDRVQTSSLIKLIPGLPLLMYRGSTETFPCKNNLLCFLKRDHQLISQEDFEQIGKLINRSQFESDRKSFKRKNLYEVRPIPEPEPKQEGLSEEL